jgi:hypothetical protein
MSNLLKDETVLEDNYPVYPDYVYIADLKLIRSEIKGTVADLKRQLDVKEIRRCDLFGHPGARLGDYLKAELPYPERNIEA